MKDYETEKILLPKYSVGLNAAVQVSAKETAVE